MTDWNPAEMIGIQSKAVGNVFVSGNNYRLYLGISER